MTHPLRIHRTIVLISIFLVSSFPTAYVRAEHPVLLPDYPQSLERQRDVLLSRLKVGGEDIGLLLGLSEVYLNLADDLYTEGDKRRRAYEKGARLAKQAFEFDEANADAHFLYAANLGNEKRLKGSGAAMLALDEIKYHVSRAILLDPFHAQALQFMGGLLAELPWFLGGDRTTAQDYLERAVSADGNFTHARILLAKLYMKQDRAKEAKEQLEAVIRAELPHYPYAWKHKFKPEAELLLRQLPN